MLNILYNCNIALAFFLELALFFALGNFGFILGKTIQSKWILAVGLITIGAIL